MGFTPLEGLVMATRSGSVDPGMLLWLLERERAVRRQRWRKRSSTTRVCSGSPAAPTCARSLDRALARASWPARLALDVYVHRLRAGIAAMAAALGGLDALVFTGGVGEHSPEVRAQTAAGLAFLGVSLDDARNDEAHADGQIGADGAAVRTLVLTAREDFEIARQVRSGAGRPAPMQG